LAIVGLLGVMKSVHTGFTARTKAWKIINGDHHGEEMSEFVTRDEFALFDLMKILSVFGFFVSLIIMLYARWGFHAVKWQKSNFTRFLVCKSKWIFGFLIVLGLMMYPYGKEMKTIFKRHHHGHKNMTADVETADVETETEAFQPRNLREMRGGHHHARFEMKAMLQNFVGDDEETCNAHAESDCHADTKCSWCLSAAVKASCHSVENAKKLPAAIFSCDNLGMTEEQAQDESEMEQIIETVEEEAVKGEAQMEKFMNTLRGGLGDDEATCNANKDDASCDAAGCSWCVCSAVPSACHSIENAKKLPSAVFNCDNLGQEESAVLNSEPTFGYGEQYKHQNQKAKCKKCCKMMHFFVIALLFAHLYMINKLADAQEAVEKANNTFTDKKWHCSMFRELKRQQISSQ